MKIGLIARTEVARGLAIQSRNFHDHMPVDRVLVIDMPRADCARDETWYPNAWHAAYNDRNHTLDEMFVRSWMEGLDVVFSVETPYDWQLPAWARSMGVRTVIQGNPEFYRHGLPGFESLQHPDAWWWPTSWRLDRLPAGPVMPVPMPDRPVTARRTGPLRLLHVMGKRAYMDRNGTEILCSALGAVSRPMEVTICGIDEQLPDVRRVRGVEVTKRPSASTDLWEMYADHDLLVMPRKYGGLCLPALEAAACGLAVAMPSCSPNEELAQMMLPIQRYAPVNLACGPVDMAIVDQRNLALSLTGLDEGAVRMIGHSNVMNHATWSNGWRDRYLAEFESVCS